jgi:hypothetical protein
MAGKLKIIAEEKHKTAIKGCRNIPIYDIIEFLILTQFKFGG